LIHNQLFVRFFLNFSMTRIALLLVAGAITLSLNACADRNMSSGSGDLLALKNMMTGDFNSRAQSERDSDYFDIRLHIRPIWTNDAANHWLYVEQATATAEAKPYRQRIYKLEYADGVYKSIVYTLPDPLSWAGAYKTPEKFNTLKPTDISLRDGCTVFLTKKGADFVGATQGNGCESNIRGAKYASSKVTITKKMLLSWDQGFDASGKQVWGAEKGGYEFVKE
jgi:CpeT protein